MPTAVPESVLSSLGDNCRYNQVLQGWAFLELVAAANLFEANHLAEQRFSGLSLLSMGTLGRLIAYCPSEGYALGSGLPVEDR